MNTVNEWINYFRNSYEIPPQKKIIGLPISNYIWSQFHTRFCNITSEGLASVQCSIRKPGPPARQRPCKARDLASLTNSNNNLRADIWRFHGNIQLGNMSFTFRVKTYFHATGLIDHHARSHMLSWKEDLFSWRTTYLRLVGHNVAGEVMSFCLCVCAFATHPCFSTR